VSAQTGDSEIILSPSLVAANANQDFTVDVVLKNPSQQNIISVRSWLKYDSTVLEGVSVDTNNSKFTLSAPGEDNVSANEGLIKIGRSNIEGGATDAKTTVATVHFRVKTTNPITTIISPYDYQVTELGHTNVNIIEQGFPLNILATEPDEISIDLNGGGTGAVTPTPQPTPTPVTPGGNGQGNLISPTNVRINTGNGFADLVWDATPDLNRVGYNVYYGHISGQYSRRRTLDNVSSIRIDGLMNGDTYYFAITAYNIFNQESDYSNEVGIIINEPLSSTAPFAGLLQGSLGRLPAQPENGPMLNWLLYGVAAISLTYFFRSKKETKLLVKNN